MLATWHEETDDDKNVPWYQNSPVRNSLMDMEKQKYEATQFLQILATLLGVLFLFIIWKAL